MRTWDLLRSSTSSATSSARWRRLRVRFAAGRANQPDAGELAPIRAVFWTCHTLTYRPALIGVATDRGTGRVFDVGHDDVGFRVFARLR